MGMTISKQTLEELERVKERQERLTMQLVERSYQSQTKDNHLDVGDVVTRTNPCFNGRR